MKKTVLTFAMLTLAAGAWAQKSSIRNAKSYLSDNNYRKAIPEADAAVANDETKNNPDAWYWRGISYYSQAADSTGKTPNSIQEAVRSFTKTVELKPDYKGDLAVVYNLALMIYNNGSAAYTKEEFSKAHDQFLEVTTLYNKTKSLGAGDPKGAAIVEAFKDLAINAKANAALSAVYSKNDDEALKLYTEIKNVQTPKDSNVYFSIMGILERQQKNEQLLTTIGEARQLWPDNKQIRNAEINYYLRTGKADELLPKLEAAAAADPQNADIQFILANMYEKMSFPKTADGKSATRPANAAEYFIKAENAYKKTLEVSPDNPEYNYNYGVLYYEYAVVYNTQANAITGTTAADDKKFKELLGKRNAQFGLALPYIDKAYTILDAKADKTEDDMLTYKQSIVGLIEIYARLENKAKMDELRKKYATIK